MIAEELTAEDARVLLQDTGPRIIECAEQGPVDIDLTEVMNAAGELEISAEIQSKDYFAVSLSRKSITLRARGHVGYIPLNQRIVVFVRPRVPVSNLTRIVNLSGEPTTLLTSTREYATDEHWTDSLLDMYATALTRAIETITLNGLIRDYTRREEVSSFPRGRVLMHRTIQDLHARGIDHAAHVAWFERTADIAPNQCLKYALWLLASRYVETAHLPRESRILHRRINALYSVFDGVQLDRDRRFLHDDGVSGGRPLPTLRAYYREGLDIARSIIEQRAVLIDQPTGLLRLPSIVVNMNHVFERYIRTVLQHHATANDWHAKVQDGNEEGSKELFNAKPSMKATPDIVIEPTDAASPLVLEVKNVPVREHFSDRSHMEQAITYAVSYGTKRVVLVHPRATTSQNTGMRRLGQIGDIELYQYRFDLGADDLAAEDARFGEAVASLLPAHSVQ
jgi:5-methylcytosine-specific restriction enzyme subunit McrC